MVHGSAGPLEALGVPADAALTPFAGSYRFLDLARATLANSGVRCPGDARHALTRGPRRRLRPRVVDARRRGRGAAAAVGGVPPLRRGHHRRASADHVLQIDLRELHAIHRDLGADVTLAGLPIPFGDQASRTMLIPARDRTLVGGPPLGGNRGRQLSWAGDLLVATRALPAHARRRSHPMRPATT